MDKTKQFTIYQVNPELLVRQMQLFLPLLDELEIETAGELSPLQVLTALNDGAGFLWAVVKDDTDIVALATGTLDRMGISITNVVGDPGLKWQRSLVDAIETFAKGSGHRRVNVIANKAWTRLLPDYKLTRVLLQKDMVQDESEDAEPVRAEG